VNEHGGGRHHGPLNLGAAHPEMMSPGPLDPGAPLEPLPGHSSRGRLERVLRAGQFAVTAELSPPDSADPLEVYHRASIFDGWVDAINATDGSGANCHMSSVGVCALLTRVGYAPVMQVSCRDKNRIAIQGDVLGGAAMGVGNVLCLTGDGVQCGDQPEAKPVFDLDSLSLIETIRIMRDEGRLLSGRSLSKPPELFIGAAENPFAPPYNFRPLRLAKKIAAGAQFIQTQYCYDIPMLERFMARARDLGLHEKCFILVGVGPLASARAARWIREHVPGVHIPDAVIERIERAPKQREEGKRLCIELIQQIREIEGVAGIHLMAYRQEESVAEIIERANVLRGRRPHNVIARWAAFQKWRAAAHAVQA
jgi:5,10-methylenetetrahydrofolate reductase